MWRALVKEIIFRGFRKFRKFPGISGKLPGFSRKSPEIPGNSREFPEISGDYREIRWNSGSFVKSREKYGDWEAEAQWPHRAVGATCNTRSTILINNCQKALFSLTFWGMTIYWKFSWILFSWSLPQEINVTYWFFWSMARPSRGPRVASRGMAEPPKGGMKSSRNIVCPFRVSSRS